MPLLSWMKIVRLSATHDKKKKTKLFNFCFHISICVSRICHFWLIGNKKQYKYIWFLIAWTNEKRENFCQGVIRSNHNRMMIDHWTVRCTNIPNSPSHSLFKINSNPIIYYDSYYLYGVIVDSCRKNKCFKNFNLRFDQYLPLSVVWLSRLNVCFYFQMLIISLSLGRFIYNRTSIYIFNMFLIWFERCTVDTPCTRHRSASFLLFAIHQRSSEFYI